MVLDAGLIDEVILIVYPVSPGKGKRLLSDSIDAHKLEFVSMVTTPTGALLNTYRHLGSLKNQFSIGADK